MGFEEAETRVPSSSKAWFTCLSTEDKFKKKKSVNVFEFAGIASITVTLGKNYKGHQSKSKAARVLEWVWAFFNALMKYSWSNDDAFISQLTVWQIGKKTQGKPSLSLTFDTAACSHDAS